MNTIHKDRPAADIAIETKPVTYMRVVANLEWFVVSTGTIVKFCFLSN